MSFSCFKSESIEEEQITGSNTIKARHLDRIGDIIINGKLQEGLGNVDRLIEIDPEQEMRVMGAVQRA